MDRGWRPDWSFEAFGDDVRLRIAFPPSYVQAGSSTAVLTLDGRTSTFGPSDVHGYEAEWRHLADLAWGEAAPVQPLETVLDDLTFALDIATGAVEQLQLSRRAA
jgi:hypothetical protein